MTVMTNKALAVASALLLMAGCSSMGDIFKSDKEKELLPSPLTDIANPIAVKKLWSVSIGEGEGELGVRQKPAVENDLIFVADSANTLMAIEKTSGKIKWSVNPDKTAKSGGLKFWQKSTQASALTGGPSVYSGLVAIGGRNGEVYAFNALDGSMLWKSMVSSSVITAPLVTFDTVVVRVNDGKIIGLDLSTGVKKWQFDRGLPSLNVRGNSTPVLGPGLIFAGYEDGTVIALRQQDGQRVWEQLIAKPDGRTELERMADIDGEIQVGDRALFASSYRNSTMAIALTNGQPLWARDIGGYAGLALLSDRVVLSDNGGNVWALERNGGADIWKQSALARRHLTTPVVQGSHVVVGDGEGYVHWLDAQTGDIKGRVEASGPVIGSPVVTDDGILLIQSVDGNLSAYSLVQ